MNEQLTKIADGWMQKTSPTFEDLSESIIQTHQSAQNTAIRAINQMATLRNWLITSRGDRYLGMTAAMTQDLSP